MKGPCASIHIFQGWCTREWPDKTLAFVHKHPEEVPGEIATLPVEMRWRRVASDKTLVEQSGCFS